MLHAFRERLHVEFRVEPQDGDPKPATATWPAAVTEGQTVRVGERPVLRHPGGAVLGVPGAEFDREHGVWRAPLSGERPGTWWVVRPDSSETAPAALFANELAPLPADRVEVRNGHWRGYDAAAGLYRMESIPAPGAYSFNSAFDNPNRRMAMNIKIRGDARSRDLLVKCSSGTGILPATDRKSVV